jgi:hypothetical protein
MKSLQFSARQEKLEDPKQEGDTLVGPALTIIGHHFLK